MVHNSRSKDTILNNRASAVDLQHLRYAVSSADHGSFRRAAEVLLVRQSTLSRCIRQLEHSIGLTLFERSSGGVAPTPAGRDFLRTARSILEQMDSLVTSAHHTSRGEAGRLAIGFYTSLSVGNLRATLVDYQKRFSKVDVSMKESSRLRLVTALRNGVIDIAIVTGEMPLLDSKGMPLWSERTLVALSEDHPLANRDIVYWTDLRSETVLLSHFPSNLAAADFMRTDLPDGLFLTWAVQSILQKYFNFPATQISSIPTAVSSQNKGRIAIVTDAG
jgi:DNA-binding transcriptional LysR family regulator